MIIAFWIMIGAAVLWAIVSVIAGHHIDSWGERAIPLIVAAYGTAIVSGVAFVGMFALHALGITISIS
ncbi:hypothetical protein [Nocardia sp. NPDC051833]|uniref:hypothetical protein n=1 Tax=Nocardia sp. NPDC051833 TaxID=3155674 RepID=UPI003431824D